MNFDRHRRAERVPLCLESVRQTMREYLESRNARIGPDFEDWVAYMFPIIKGQAGRRDSLQVNTLANWADRYLHSDLGADRARRAQRRTDAFLKASERVREP